jgi:hypothetical protein
MGQLIDNMQTKIKAGSTSLLAFALRLCSGLLFGLTITIIGQTIFNYSTLLYVFVLLITLSVFMRLTRSWAWTGLLLLDLIFALIAMLLRMYIVVAPG